jgi:hypothetical protein
LLQRQPIGVSHDGDEEAVVQRHRQTDVDVGKHCDPVVGDLRVDVGMCASARAAAATT